MNTFISKDNIDLLWEVLLEEPILKNISNGNQKLIYNALHTNISSFYDKEKHESFDLVTLNKNFLGEMLKVIRNNKPEKEKEKEKEKENIKFKVEDIHAERKHIFEKDLEKRKNDFEMSITLKKPPIPDFTEKIEDEKIKGMEELIAKTVAQRNFDISLIKPNMEAEYWLKPQETSIKPVEFKTIKIEEQVPNEKIPNEIIELSNLSSRKKISWSKENDIKYFNSTEMLTPATTTTSIINKLKKNDVNNENNNDNNFTKLSNDYLILKEKTDNMDKKIDEITLSLEKIFELINNINK